MHLLLYNLAHVMYIRKRVGVVHGAGSSLLGLNSIYLSKKMYMCNQLLSQLTGSDGKLSLI